MTRTDRWTHWHAAVGIATAVCLVAALVGGCPGFQGLQGPEGPEGPQGPQGPQGPAGTPGDDGLDAGATLPGTVVEVASINGGTAVTPGAAFTVTFTVEDPNGDTIQIDDLDRMSAYVSGPTTNYQRVITADSDPNNFVQNADGTYTWTPAGGFPATYAAPYNDSTAYGAADGELTGEAIANGTYTVGLEMRRTFGTADGDVRRAGDAAEDFVIGGGSVVAHELVLRDTCNTCHVDLQFHGSNRFLTTGCVLCHTNGAEDTISADADKATPGGSIELAQMIHKLHRGADLPRVSASANSADPYLYEIVGRNENVTDFSHVEFPFVPGGTGFNEQVRNCAACHAGAAQADEIYADENITRFTCTSCHDDLNFTSGTILDGTNNTVAAGEVPQSDLDDATYRVAPGGVTHQFNDGSCVFCHGQGQIWAVEPAHLAPLSDPNNILDMRVEISSVDGESGAGFFQPGDNPVITFNVVDGNGDDVAIDDLTVQMVVSGPVQNYQRVFPVDGAASTTVSLKNAGGVPATGTGPFTYTSPTAIPATYPLPFNDSADFTYADGWGELSGLPLINGDYTVLIYAYRAITVGGTNYREASLPGLFEIRIGSDGPTPGYYELVTDAKCNACHGDLRFHGNGRRGVANCVMCHVAGAEDRPNVVAGQTQDPAPDSIDWKVMIHKLHYGSSLTVVQDGGAYDLVGFAAGEPADTGNVTDFSQSVFPAFPIGVAECTTCHATDAWEDPIADDNVNVWMVTCTSCHDSTATSVHVALNTLGVGQEGCAVCHGVGKLFSVAESHAAP